MTPTAVSAPPNIAPSSRLVASCLLAGSMCLTSLAAHQLRPTKLFAETRGSAPLSALVPDAFGEWHTVQTAQPVVNPQSRQLIDTLYTEVLNRTYRNAAGQQVMLAIAYGRDQSDELQVHEPLVCYPAQGFKVIRHGTGDLPTAYGSLPVHRLETALGEVRFEPVTYWTTIGDQVVEPRPFDKKLKKFGYALKGYIPDGLLFRVSSVDADAAGAFALHERFSKDLLASVSPTLRHRLAGLPRPAAAEH